MRVILLENIPSVGVKYAVKDVADGYARNFLFPKKLAIIAAPTTLKELEAKKAAFEKKEGEIKKRLAELAKMLEGRRIILPVKTNEQGAVFGSITKEKILKELRDVILRVGLTGKERISIKLDHPLKQLGEYEIEVDLKKGIAAKIIVVLEPLD